MIPIILTIIFIIPNNAFIITPPKHTKQTLKSSNDVQSFKESLSRSWNNKMGILPTTPKSAAKAASASLKQAQETLFGIKNIFFIDVGLPSYEITLTGKNVNPLYDEIMVMQFCIELSRYLYADGGKKVSIMVRDGETLRLIENVLDIRRSTNTDGVDSYREQLLTSWDDDETTSSKENDSFREQLLSSWDEDTEPIDEGTKPVDNDENKTNGEYYDIISLFGDETISQGPDMFDDVLSTLSKLQPLHDMILITSPYTMAELIAIRRLIALYPEKTIIVFNCKLDRSNYPREFSFGEIVYSIIPLVVKKRSLGLDSNLFDSFDDNDIDEANVSSSMTKIVLMRRYPDDWELYIDDDKGVDGFQLIQSFDAETMVSKHGPTMDVIANCVKRYMQIGLSGDR